MRRVILEPLTQDAFAPYGDVMEPPGPGARVSLLDTLVARGAATQPVLSFSNAPPTQLPILATQMERHMLTSQCFVPMDVARWVVMVAPDIGGRPDVERLRAFLVRGDQAVNYHLGSWHHPVQVLDRPGRFAVLMWTTGHKPEDEAWATLPEPVTITGA